MESLTLWLCLGLASACWLALLYLPLALLATYGIAAEGRPALFDVGAVLQETTAPLLRWASRSPTLSRPATNTAQGLFDLLGLYSRNCTRDDVDRVAALWCSFMARNPWRYPASQRQRLRGYHRDALAYLETRDALQQALRDAIDAAVASSQREPSGGLPGQAGGATYSSWRATLGLAHGEYDVERIKLAYRKLARQAHPDRGGTHDAMARLNQAMAQARKELAFV